MRAWPQGVGLSRRQIIGTGAATAALVPSFLCPAAQGQNLTPNLAPNLAADDTVVAAGQDRDSHMTIDVAINGRGPFHFVVDTGADRSVLADTTVAALGLPAGSPVMVEGVVRTVAAPTAVVGAIAFGDKEIENCHLPVLPRAWLRADGFIGLDMLKNALVTFDFRNERLLVERSRSGWLLSSMSPYEDAISAGGAGGHLRVLNCRVDGVLTAVFIDSGAEVSVGNEALFLALKNSDPDYRQAYEGVRLAGVTGGELIGQVADFHKIKIRDVSFTNGTIAFVDLQIFTLWDLADRPALLVGMNFLRQFSRVSIDFGHKAFLFQVAGLTPMVAARDRAIG